MRLVDSCKRDIVAKLLPQVFEWARSANPSQPLTSGVWWGDAAEWAELSPTIVQFEEL